MLFNIVMIHHQRSSKTAPMDTSICRWRIRYMHCNFFGKGNSIKNSKIKGFLTFALPKPNPGLRRWLRDLSVPTYYGRDTRSAPAHDELLGKWYTSIAFTIRRRVALSHTLVILAHFLARVWLCTVGLNCSRDRDSLKNIIHQDKSYAELPWTNTTQYPGAVYTNTCCVF